MNIEKTKTLRPSVSVVIPSYNCLEYLPKAFNSIRAQKMLEDIEIVVADDASTDGSWDWLQDRLHQTPKLRCIRTPGVGPAEARNRCIEAAKSELIAFLDADDRWWPNKLAAQVKFHQDNPDVVFSFTNYRCVTPEKAILDEGFEYWQQFLPIARRESGYRVLRKAPAVLFAENPVGTSSVMARRGALLRVNGFDPSLPSAEDWDLWLRLAALGRVAFTDQIGMDYLVRPGSETAKSQARIDALEIIYGRYVEAAAYIDQTSPRLARARIATAKAEYLRMLNRYFDALQQHLRSFSLFPSTRTLRAAGVDAIRMFKPAKVMEDFASDS